MLFKLVHKPTGTGEKINENLKALEQTIELDKFWVDSRKNRQFFTR
jgi:hypothetical protein